MGGGIWCWGSVCVSRRSLGSATNDSSDISWTSSLSLTVTASMIWPEWITSLLNFQGGVRWYVEGEWGYTGVSSLVESRRRKSFGFSLQSWVSVCLVWRRSWDWYIWEGVRGRAWTSHHYGGQKSVVLVCTEVVCPECRPLKVEVWRWDWKCCWLSYRKFFSWWGFFPVYNPFV